MLYIRISSIWNLIYAFVNFNIHQSIDKKEYYPGSLITCKPLKLTDIVFQINIT